MNKFWRGMAGRLQIAFLSSRVCHLLDYNLYGPSGLITTIVLVFNFPEQDTFVKKVRKIYQEISENNFESNYEFLSVDDMTEKGWSQNTS